MMMVWDLEYVKEGGYVKVDSFFFFLAVDTVQRSIKTSFYTSLQYSV